MGTAGELSVAQNLTLAEKHTGSLSLRRYRRAGQTARYTELLANLNMGLEQRLNTQVKYLSGGQRQASSLLMATLSQPQLLLLDEHTAALDPQTSREVMALTYGNRLVMVQDGQIKLDVRGEAKQNLQAEEDLMGLFSD